MKKVVLIAAILLMVSYFSSTVSAQSYVVFDGKTAADFNVMFKLNSNETQILEVSFTNADKSSWVKFSIDNFKELEDGFAYYVKDGKGKTFRIDYFSYSDEVLITNETTYDTWVLYRRP